MSVYFTCSQIPAVSVLRLMEIVDVWTFVDKPLKIFS